MKRQKHYTSQAEIDKDIDKAMRKMVKYREEANLEDEKASYLIDQRNPADAEQIVWFKESANALREKAYRIEEVRLVKLKRLGAAFKTMLLPGVTKDKSVTIENL